MFINYKVLHIAGKDKNMNIHFIKHKIKIYFYTEKG